MCNCSRHPSESQMTPRLRTIELRCCGHAFYCLVLSFSNYLMHILTSDVVLLLPFFDLFNIYNFCVKLFNNNRE